MKSMQQFLLWCSGVNTKALEEAKTAETKYVCLGGAVLSTGVLAYLSSFSALYAIFRSQIIATVGATLWALFIFNLDRFVLATMRRQRSPWKEIGIAAPRLLFTVLIAYAFSVPLELRLFQEEVTAEVTRLHNVDYEQAKSRINSAPAFAQEKRNIAADNRMLENAIQAAQERADQREAELTAEYDGTGGSRQRGIGPDYHHKEQLARQANADMQAVKFRSQEQIKANQKRLNELEATQQQQLEIEAQASRPVNGFLEQYRALNSLKDRYRDVANISLFLTVFMLMLETAPLTVKLLASHNPRNPYDSRLDALEAQEEEAAQIDAYAADLRVETEKARLRAQQKTDITQTEVNAGLEEQLRADRESQYLITEKEAYGDALGVMREVKQKLAQRVAEVWLKHQEAKLRSDPAHFVDLI